MAEWIKKFADNFKVTDNSRDPATFKDEIASRTQWTPFPKMTSNIDLHRLIENAGYNLRYQPTVGFYFMCGIVMLVGIGSSVVTLINEKKPLDDVESLMSLALGGLFFIIGIGMAIVMRRRLVFDTVARVVQERDKNVYFDEVHAIQLVAIRQNKYINYQINLVLRDAERLYIMNYRKPETARRDAEKIADTLGVPRTRIWDALPDHDKVVSGR